MSGIQIGTIAIVCNSAHDWLFSEPISVQLMSFGIACIVAELIGKKVKKK